MTADSSSAHPAYADLYFGKSDSRNELAGDRDDFLRSFVNIKGIVEEVVAGEKTLVLGPKGTGKTALAWYLNESQRGADFLCQVRDASELPLADIPRLHTGQPAGPERTVAAWRFILLANYLNLLLKDTSCEIPDRHEVDRVTRLLRQYGLLGDTVGRAIVDISSTTIEIPIPKVGSIYRRESRRTLNIFSLLPYLEDWATNARSGNRHILILDGLDSIFLNDNKYDESLASLVQAAYSINQRLSGVGATGSIVLLLRHDVFGRVSMILPDSQKMRDDFAVELDWRVLSGSQGTRAPLLRLANQKAARALELESIDVLSYFPSRITVGKASNGAPRHIDRLQYLLNLTRHTPRDLLRLFEEIRKVEHSGVFGDSRPTLSSEVIREGVVQYATKYFTGAIRNEFAGYEGGPQEAALALSALQRMERQSFQQEDFVRHLNSETPVTATQSARLLSLLFLAGAVGNLVKKGNESYLNFYHRRDDVEVYTQGTLVMHNALCHAWNVPFSI